MPVLSRPLPVTYRQRVDDMATPAHGEEIKKNDLPPYDLEDLKAVDEGKEPDAFGDEANAEVKYKTLKWWYVLLRYPPSTK